MATITSVILSMAGRTIGVRADEVHGLEQRQIVNCLARLALAGKLHRVKLDAKNVRFFKTVAMGDVFAKKAAAATAKSTHARTWAKPIKACAPWPANAVATVPKGLVIQRGYSHPPRNSEHTFSFVHGGLRCA